MRSDDTSQVSQRVQQILHPAAAAPPSAESFWDDVEAAGDAWPPGWPEQRADTPADSASHTPVRERLTAGGQALRAGPRWEVPVRAAIAAAVLALLLVGVSFVLMTRGKTPAANVAVRETSSLSVNSSPSMTSTPVLAVGPAPVSSAAGQPPAPTPSNPAQVYVVGQVRRPGVVALATDARVEDAIQAAGGATGRADLTEMNLARKIVDGERILVPKPGQAVPAVDPVPAAVDDGAAASGAGPAAAPGAPVDLNTATATELDALPGVGPVLAGRIVAWRQANGGFKQVDDLGEVQGIGDATLAKLRPMVRI